MKPHPRIRKTIKWGGAAATVLLVAVWVASGWWYFPLGNRGPWILSCAEGRGAIQYDSNALFENHRFSIQRIRRGELLPPEPFTIQWRFSWNQYDNLPPAPSHHWCLVFPLWAPMLPALVMSVIAWRLDTLARRRAKLNLCPKCGYDRTGLAASAKCPECGSEGLPA